MSKYIIDKEDFENDLNEIIERIYNSFSPDDMKNQIMCVFNFNAKESAE